MSAGGALLVRVARQADLPEGGKVVKETHGRKVLLARTGGQVYATDAHCFHMGGNLWEGDIEDIDGHACVVCPLHRYKIDMATGQKVDTMLDGCVTCSSGPQQRTYRVAQDPDFIWLDIPELHTQQALPSDRYNQVAAAPAPRTGYGLFGSGGGAQPAETLAPYSGFPQRRGLLPDTPSKGAGQDEPATLSQEGLQFSQEAPAQAQQQPAQQQQQQQQFTQAHIPFAQSRADTAFIARRKAATAAIAARSYMPPAVDPPAPRGLFGAAPVPAPQKAAAAAQRPSGPARTTSGQASLLNFGFTVQRQPAATAGSADDMDMS